MTMKAPPEGERLARLEVAVEGLAHEIIGLRSDIRDIRTMMNRFMFAMIAMWVITIIIILFIT